MNAANNASLAAKQAAGINIHLYSDDHPETTLKGTGFKDAATAHRTIKLVEQNKPRNRQIWTINAMYYRAKHHPSQTLSMRNAMKVFEVWLEEYRNEKRDKNGKSKTSQREKKADKKRPRTKVTGNSNDDNNDNECSNDNGSAKKKTKKSTKINSPPSTLSSSLSSTLQSRRSELETEYKKLFNITLPEVARTNKWPIYRNHCVMRVALDAYWQCCWYEKLDQKKGALKSMTVPQIENVILVGERMASEGKTYVTRLNNESLAYRGKQGSGGSGGGVGGGERSQRHVVTMKKNTQQQLQSATTDRCVADPVRSMTTAEATSPTNRKNGANSSTNSNNHQNRTELCPLNNNVINDKFESSIEYNKDALLQVQYATTGRASCRGCKEKIGKGEHRVGMKVWSSGRVITVWHHPACFVGITSDDTEKNNTNSVVRVEKVSKGSSARCKYTGSRFIKGDLRLVLQVGVTKNYYHALAAINPLLAPVYDAIGASTLPLSVEEGEEKSLSSPLSTSLISPTTLVECKSNLQGLDQLERNDRDAILAALCSERHLKKEQV